VLNIAVFLPAAFKTAFIINAQLVFPFEPVTAWQFNLENGLPKFSFANRYLVKTTSFTCAHLPSEPFGAGKAEITEEAPFSSASRA